VYSRYGNPTVDHVRGALRLIEGAPAAFATASGMARGVHLAGRAAGRRGSIGGRAQPVRLVLCGVQRDPAALGYRDCAGRRRRPSQWEQALSVPTQAVFFETPSNPMQSLVDITAVTGGSCRWAQKVVLDNVLPTTLLQQGFPLGGRRGCVLRTKHIDGQAGSWRRHPRRQGVHRRTGAKADATHRPA